MLVLSRKVGEKLVLGDNVIVEVVRISGNRITLGIVAPSDVRILRGELQPKPMQLKSKPSSESQTSEESDIEATQSNQCSQSSQCCLMQAS